MILSEWFKWWIEFSEFTALDKQLDDLNSVLDAIVAKNDDIQVKAKQFIETSRQERLQMKSSGNNSENSNNTEKRGSLS